MFHYVPTNPQTPAKNRSFSKFLKEHQDNPELRLRLIKKTTEALLKALTNTDGGRVPYNDVKVFIVKPLETDFRDLTGGPEEVATALRKSHNTLADAIIKKYHSHPIAC